jgi:glycosyltransferase involved in cell wall biosynthesis
MLPLVSIIITNHNLQHLVWDAVESIVDQDYPNKQIVLIDDASTDDSKVLIANKLGVEEGEAVYRDTKVHFISLKTNAGRSKARNIGIKHVWEETDIFGNLDGDDLYLPGKISKSVAKILEDPQVIGAVYSDYEVHNFISNTWQSEHKRSFDHRELRRDSIVNNDSLVTKLALANAGGYDEGMEVAEDWDLWLRVSKHFLIVHIPEVLVRLRVTSQGCTASVDVPTWNKNFMKIRERLATNVY